MAASMSDTRTRLAQALHYIDGATGAVVPPIHPSTTFARDGQNNLIGFCYSREGSPTTAHAEKAIAILDGAADAALFASGMAAINAIVETLDAGDGIVLPRVMYHGARKWMLRQEKKRGIRLTFFDAAVPGALEQAVSAASPKLVWVETPVNPSFDVIDIAAAAQAAHKLSLIHI